MRPIHALSVLLVAAALVGCGGGDDDDGGSGGGSANPPASSQPADTSRAGADVFGSAGCGSCHTFKAENAQGATGPNLDQLQPSFEDVRDQVANGGGGMPAYDDELTENEIELVARYVADNAGG